MGWKGAIRSMQAASRQADRDALRRQCELERQQKDYEKFKVLQRATHDVKVFENHIEQLASIHKESSEPVNWDAIAESEPPPAPLCSNAHEQAAYNDLESYAPGFVDKLFSRTAHKRQQLTSALEEAKKSDGDEFKVGISQHRKDQSEWEAEQNLAKRILDNEPESYIDAINLLDPFSEISDLGSNIHFKVDDSRIICVEISVHSEDVVPKQSKSLLKSGKLSVKQIPKGRFYEMYQDYVCSCALRIANELFCLLPINAVVITAVDDLLNSKTGHLEEKPVLSVAIPRETFEKLNLDAIDPSDSMQNFIHNMAFKKTKGLGAVERVEVSQLKLTEIT